MIALKTNAYKKYYGRISPLPPAKIDRNHHVPALIGVRTSVRASANATTHGQAVRCRNPAVEKIARI